MDYIVLGIGVLNLSDVCRKMYFKDKIEQEVSDEITDDCIYKHVTSENPNFAVVVESYKYSELSVLKGLLSFGPFMFLHTTNPFKNVKEIYNNVQFQNLKHIDFKDSLFLALKSTDNNVKHLDPNVKFPTFGRYNVYSDVYKPGENVLMYIRKGKCLAFSSNLNYIATCKYSLIPNMLVFLPIMCYGIYKN